MKKLNKFFAICLAPALVLSLSLTAFAAGAMTEDGLADINTANTVYTSGVRRGYSDCYMVINYAATVNSDADTVMGGSGNPNEVVLTWKRTNTAYFDTMKDDCHFYTYGLDLTKEFTTDEGSFADVKFVMENKNLSCPGSEQIAMCSCAR